MSPEQQRIAIAEACGWKEAIMITANTWVGCLDGSALKPIPHYTDDLNAMHEAEKTLGDLWDLYADQLCANRPEEPSAIKCVMFATAAQRAEAFLKIKGKWEE